jgi:hypothetical protein
VKETIRGRVRRFSIVIGALASWAVGTYLVDWRFPTVNWGAKIVAGLLASLGIDLIVIVLCLCIFSFAKWMWHGTGKEKREEKKLEE